jgi:hypothetical protein
MYSIKGVLNKTTAINVKILTKQINFFNLKLIYTFEMDFNTNFCNHLTIYKKILYFGINNFWESYY